MLFQFNSFRKAIDRFNMAERERKKDLEYGYIYKFVYQCQIDQRRSPGTITRALALRSFDDVEREMSILTREKFAKNSDAGP